MDRTAILLMLAAIAVIVVLPTGVYLWAGEDGLMTLGCGAAIAFIFSR